MFTPFELIWAKLRKLRQPKFHASATVTREIVTKSEASRLDFRGRSALYSDYVHPQDRPPVQRQNVRQLPLGRVRPHRQGTAPTGHLFARRSFARPPEQWLALARKLQDALTGQLSLPGLADEDPELRQLVQALPAATPPLCDVAVTATVPSELVAVHVDRVTVEEPRPAGHIHVGREFWKRLGLDEILKSLDFSPRLIKLTCAMTLNRLIHPAAEYAMPDWIRSTAMADILGVDFTRLVDDPLYRNLDRLHPHRGAIESALAQREQSLFNLGNTILLYDLTSTYFEGTPLASPKPSAATPATIGRTANKSSWDWSSAAKDFLAPTKSSRAISRIGNR